MADKRLYLLATFDEETSAKMNTISTQITKHGILDEKTADIPYHLTLAVFDISLEEHVRDILHGICEKTKAFDLVFNHIGLFGLKVLFLAPDINHELLALRGQFESCCSRDERGWTAHATLLISNADGVLKAVPIVAREFAQIHAKVMGISLYEFFPKRLIAKYELQ